MHHYMSDNGLSDTITIEWLREHRACNSQVHAFMTLWPQGAPLTRRNLVAAARAGLKISWLAQFLPASTKRTCDEAIAAAARTYGEAVAFSKRAYNEAVAAAAECVYGKATAAAERACDETIAAAARTCDADIAAAKRVYGKATAHALADALGV